MRSPSQLWGPGLQLLFLSSTVQPTPQHMQGPIGRQQLLTYLLHVPGQQKRKGISLNGPGRTGPVALCSCCARAWVVAVARRRDPSFSWFLRRKLEIISEDAG